VFHGVFCIAWLTEGAIVDAPIVTFEHVGAVVSHPFRRTTVFLKNNALSIKKAAYLKVSVLFNMLRETVSYRAEEIRLISFEIAFVARP